MDQGLTARIEDRNLLGNALTHGDPGKPGVGPPRSGDSGFELSVANQGEPIPLDTVDRLFQPFSRASARPGQQGLGLGLYIASEMRRRPRGQPGGGVVAGRDAVHLPNAVSGVRAANPVRRR